MVIALVIAIVLIVLVFGVQSAMQSYASAQQAKATIETAQVAQITAFGNVFMIVVATLVFLAIIGLVMYVIVRVQQMRNDRFIQPQQPRTVIHPPAETPLLTSSELDEFMLSLFDMMDERK